MREHWTKRITEAGGGKIGKRGEEDVDGKKGREEAVGEVIERVRRNSDLDDLGQRLLRCMVDPRKFHPLPVRCIPVEPSRRNIKQHLLASAPSPA